jgi:hypothetical protein
MNEVTQFFLQLLAYGGGSATIAFLIFRFLGKTWIESKFSQRLEQFKHQQALEIQRLRIEIDSTLSGVLKIQEKEFQTLPEAWSKLDEAFSWLSSVSSPMRTYPDLDRMSGPELDEFLGNTELLETQKDQVRAAERKVKKYSEIIFWHHLHKVNITHSELHMYVVRNGILFPEHIKKKFESIIQEMRSAIGALKIGKESEDYRMQHEAWEKVQRDINPMFDAIGAEINIRLQSHGRRS